MTPLLRPLGDTFPVVTTCPHCSYLWDGKCIVCPDGDPHPACEGCVGGRLPRPPWYRSELFIALATTVAVSVATAIIVPRVERLITKK